MGTWHKGRGKEDPREEFLTGLEGKQPLSFGEWPLQYLFSADFLFLGSVSGAQKWLGKDDFEVVPNMKLNKCN